MRYLYVRPSDALRRRLAVAAATEGRSLGRYCRRLIEQAPLRTGPGPGPETAPAEAGTVEVKVPLSDETHAALRVRAAQLDVSLAQLGLALLAARAPDLTEVATAILLDDH